eukprot:scaffold34685_cov183-Amphora_coffeaeformis.AAC.3
MSAEEETNKTNGKRETPADGSGISGLSPRTGSKKPRTDKKYGTCFCYSLPLFGRSNVGHDGAESEFRCLDPVTT